MLLSRRNRSTLDSIAQVFRPYQKVHLPQSLASGCGSYHLVFLLDLELKKKQLGPQMNWRNQVKVHVMMEPMKIVWHIVFPLPTWKVMKFYWEW